MITNIAFKGHATRRFLKNFLFHKWSAAPVVPKLNTRAYQRAVCHLHDETDKLSPPE